MSILQVRRDALAHEFVQFFYSDLQHPRRVTHVVDGVARAGGGGVGRSGGSARWRVSELFYDTQGKLFAMRRESELFYIALDPTDSPIVVLNGVGSVVKQVSRRLLVFSAVIKTDLFDINSKREHARSGLGQ